MKEQSVIKDNYEPLLGSLEKNTVLDLERLTFNDNNIVHLAGMCTYLYMLQVSLSINALYKSESHYSYPILLRSLIEAYADLANVFKQDNYARRMIATEYHEKVRVLNRVPNFPNDPFLKYIAQNEEGNRAIRETFEKLKNDGYTKIGVSDKFTLAEMSEFYVGIYWHFCLYSHANIAILQERHIERLEGDSIQVVFDKEVTREYLILCLDTLVSLWIDSSLKIHQELGSPQQERYKGLQNSLAVARGK